jgi:arylformamidase
LSNVPIDISLPIGERMHVWPGDEPPRHRWNARILAGDPATVSNWTLGCHTGTHVDAPSHFVAGGADIEAIDLAGLVGEAIVIDVDDEDGLIPAAAIEDADLGDCKRVLLKTRNSYGAHARATFARDFVSLHPDAARALVERGVRTVGIDYLSVEKFLTPEEEESYSFPVHRLLLGAGVTVIEGLDLGGVGTGRYALCCLPLLLVGSEAAPARAVLIPLERDGCT